ncbi:MAG: primase-helicase family protein [Chryseotalea sp.]
MNTTTVLADETYLLSRLVSLGLSPEKNKFILSSGEKRRLFEADEDGNIIINYFNLHSNHYSWKKPGTKYPRYFQRKRLKQTFENQKYSQPKNSPQFPYFTPGIIKAYNDSKSIQTLFIVEGEFKALKGWLCGLDIIGIPSIHGFYSNELKGKLNEDIEKVIIQCRVKNIVFIADADVLTTNWAEGKDLSKRATSFYSAIKNFRESLQLLIDNPVELIVFSHILSKYNNENGKGLDDILSTYTSLHERIIEDLYKLHLATDFFRGFILNNINSDLKKIFKYLGLNSASEFYQTYENHIAGREFIFRGKKFIWNSDTNSINEICSEVPYIRVGVKFYKKIYTPQADGQTLLNLKEWTRSIIELDHGKEYVQKIERFEDWCYVPEHIEYQQSINGFYNRYYALRHIPQNGECYHTLKFIKHIFGEHYEKGLDYLQLLYTKPRQILPVLCLVSEERNTGKTTFLNWLTSIFGRNATINRNEDFESQFNSGWAGKLIIAVDETFIDRKKVYERIKSLSTGKTMKVEAKGQDSIDSEFFGKVILCSNNEDSFIPVDSSEIRFWVRKVIPFENEDPHLLTNFLIPEIPNFLQLLIERKISTPQKTRMWFSQADIQTDALTAIINRNKSYLEKELTEQISELLFDWDLDEIKFTITDLSMMLAVGGIREPQFKIKELITRKWKLNYKNSTYTKWVQTESGERNSFTAKGKYYTFSRELFGLNKRDGENNPATENPVDRVDNINF